VTKPELNIRDGFLSLLGYPWTGQRVGYAGSGVGPGTQVDLTELGLARSGSLQAIPDAQPHTSTGPWSLSSWCGAPRWRGAHIAGLFCVHWMVTDYDG
jgi:hypothetical protein